MDDITEHLLDDESLAMAAASEDDQCCPVCGTLSSSPHPFKAGAAVAFVRTNKDEFCHGIHMLLHGEQPWGELVSELNRPGSEKKAVFLKNRGVLIQFLQHHPDPNWSADPTQQIFTEREVVTKMTPIGCLLVYTGDSYAREHNGREPAEDNLKMEPVTLPNGTQSRGVKVWSGPQDVFKVEVTEESRVLHRRRLDNGFITLMKDQQTSRFDRRRNLLLDHVKLLDFKKLPLDPPKAGLCPEGSAPSVLGAPLDAQSIAGTAMPAAAAAEEEALELAALGLDAPSAKAKGKSGPKVKRTRLEMLQEEVQKVTSEWNTLLSNLTHFPDTPKPQDVSRVERMLKAKVKELKDNFQFEQVQELTKTLEELDVLRQSMKPAQSFTTGTMSTRKKVGSEFYEKLLALKNRYPTTFARYPGSVKTSFHDMQITKLLEKREWAAIGEVLTHSQAESDIDHMDVFERLIGIFLKQLDGCDDRDKVKECGLKLHEALLIVSHFTKEDVKRDIFAIAAVAGQKPLADQSTLDDPLALVLSSSKQPAFRVLHGTGSGNQLLQLAAGANQQPTAARDALSSLAQLKEFFLQACEQDVAKAFLANGTDDENLGFNAWTSAVQEKCCVFNAIMTSSSYDDLLRDASNAATDAFLKLCSTYFPGLQRHLVDRLLKATKMLDGDTMVNVNSDDWTVLTQPATDFLLQQLNKFCEKGGIFLLLQQLKTAGVADPDMVKHMESSALLINLANFLTQLMELMGKTAANENTASMWVEQLPRFVAGSKAEEQHQIFRDLGALLADRTPETIKDIDAGLLRLGFNHLAKSSAVMGQLQDTALPDLWSSMVEDFKNGLLSKQAWFSAVAGQDAKTLPEPSERADRLFFEKCASHQVPSLEVLSQIAPLVDDSEKMSEMVNQHKADNLMLKTASVLHQILLLTGEVPIPAAVPQLEAIAKEIAELMEMEQAMGLEGAAKESVRKFFTAHITTKFFAAADCVVSCVQNMQKAIPDQYEKLVEQRNVAQLKAALFSKRTHGAVTSNQDLAVAGTEAMRSVVKSSGHVTSGGCLGRFRTHDSALKAVRCYTTTVHGLNILLHKLPPPGKQNRERAAMIREYKKAWEKTKIPPAKPLMSWMTEAAQSK